MNYFLGCIGDFSGSWGAGLTVALSWSTELVNNPARAGWPSRSWHSTPSAIEHDSADAGHTH